MTWFRLDEKGCFHPKVVRAGNEAYGAWTRAGQWSSEHLTDGVIPPDVARAIGPRRLWKRLVDVGLCEKIDEKVFAKGTSPIEMHDFLDYNPSAEEVLAERERKAANVKEWRDRRKRERAPRVTGNGAGNLRPLLPGGNHGPDPDPDPDPVREERAPAPTESGYDLAWRVWGELWPPKYGEPYQRSIDTGRNGDDRTMQRVGALALEHGARAEEVLRSKLKLYLACEKPAYRSNRHPPRFFHDDWNSFGKSSAKRLHRAAVESDESELTDDERTAIRKRMEEREAWAAKERERRAAIDQRPVGK